LIARLKVNLDVRREAREDLAELAPEARTEAINAIATMLAHPRAGDAKTGRLEGSRSWSFPSYNGDESEEGRILYFLLDRAVVVFAIHADHDEAYKRARARAPRYL